MKDLRHFRVGDWFFITIKGHWAYRLCVVLNENFEEVKIVSFGGGGVDMRESRIFDWDDFPETVTFGERTFDLSKHFLRLPSSVDLHYLGNGPKCILKKPTLKNKINLAKFKAKKYDGMVDKEG